MVCTYLLKIPRNSQSNRFVPNRSLSQPSDPDQIDCDDLEQWANGRPNDADSSTDCGLLQDSSIIDENCEEERAYVCEFDDSHGEQSALAIESANGATYVGFNYRPHSNFDEAVQKCAIFGGQLATFDDQQQFEAMQCIRAQTGGSLLIGLHDRNVEHEWEFIDGDHSYWFVCV